jgi:hypothetical protein
MGPSIIIPRWVEQEVMGQHHSTYAATLRKGGQHSGVTRNTDFHADLELAGGCRMDSKVSELLDQRTAFRGILRFSDNALGFRRGRERGLGGFALVFRVVYLSSSPPLPPSPPSLPTPDELQWQWFVFIVSFYMERSD